MHDEELLPLQTYETINTNFNKLVENLMQEYETFTKEIYIIKKQILKNDSMVDNIKTKVDN